MDTVRDGHGSLLQWPSSRLSALRLRAVIVRLLATFARGRSAGVAIWRSLVTIVRVVWLGLARRTIGNQMVVALAEVAALRQRSMRTLGGDVAAEIAAIVAPGGKTTSFVCEDHLLC